MTLRFVRAGMLAALVAAGAGAARAANTVTIDEETGLMTITTTSITALSKILSDDQLVKLTNGTVKAVVKNGGYSFTNDFVSLEGYTGPWTINAGEFVCRNPGCLGAGVVTQKSTVVSFLKNATWTNSVVFTSTSECTLNHSGGAMKGDISSVANLNLKASSALTYSGRISAPGKKIYPYSSNNGAQTFNGAITAYHFGLPDYSSSCRPNWYISSPDNAIDLLNSTYGIMHLNGVNCATNALLKLGYTENNGDSNLRAAFYFNKSQMFRAFEDCPTSYHSGSTSYHTSWIQNGSRITINGDLDVKTDMKFCGSGSIAWYPPTRHTITFHNDRYHPLSGGLIVSNGVFAVSATTAFPNITSITAGQGGYFNFDSTGSLANMRAITAMSCSTVNVAKTSSSFVADYISFDLSSDSVVDMGERGSILLAKSFKVDGEHLAGGYYTGEDSTAEDATKIPQLRGNTVIQVPEYEAPTEACTWDAGAGADDTSVQTAANWADDALPDFTSTGAWPTFATAGVLATVDKAIALKGMTFSGAESFKVDATDEGSVSLYQGGLLFSGDGTTARTYTIGVPLVQRTTASWMVEGSKTVAKLRAPVSSVGSLTTVKGGAGTLEVSSTNTFTGAFTITNGTVNVYSKKDPFGAGEGVLRFKGSGTPKAYLLFKNFVEMDKTCAFEVNSGENPSSRFRLAEGSGSNVFHKPVTFTGDTLYISMGSYGATIFEDKFTASNYLAMQANGHAVHFKGLVDVNNWSAQGGIHAYLYQPNNKTPTWNMRIGCAVTCMTNDVFSKCTNLTLTDSNNPTWYLNGFNQRVASLTAYSGGRVINSGAPMRLTLTGAGNLYAGSSLTGPVDFTLNADAKTFNVYIAVAATGNIEVKAGTLAFGSGASWLGATNVVVSGGTLKLPAKAVFHKKTPVTVSGSGTIDLASGLEQRIASLVLPEGTAKVGTWGAEGAVDAKGNPVEHTSSSLAGTGCFRVGPLGLAVYLK